MKRKLTKTQVKEAVKQVVFDKKLAATQKANLAKLNAITASIKKLSDRLDNLVKAWV